MADSQSDFVTLFVEEWQKLADGEKLADIFVLEQEKLETKSTLKLLTVRWEPSFNKKSR
ncbi:MAG: hypothetical protein R2769_04945 [Saprospiraceae bacterium]